MKKELIINDRIIKKFQKYLKNEEKAESTISSYIRSLSRLCSFLQNKPVTKELLLKFKAELTKKFAVTSTNNVIAALNSFFKFAQRNDLIIKQLRVQKNTFLPEEKVLTKKEYKKLIQAAQKASDERLALIIQTICSTGIRVSELKFITSESVILGRTVVNNKGKTRLVHIPSELCKILKRYAQKKSITSGAIFVTKNGKNLNRSNLWRDMKKLAKKAKIDPKKVYPHNLRHLFAKTFYKRTKDIVRLSEHLGHSSINTTRIYTKECGSVYARQIEGLGLIVNTT